MAAKKQDKRSAPEAAKVEAKKQKVEKVETLPTRRSTRSVSISESVEPKKAVKVASKAKAEPKAKEVVAKPAAKKADPKPKATKKVEEKVEPKKEPAKKAEPVKKAEKAEKPAKKAVEKKPVEPKVAKASPKKAAKKEEKVDLKSPKKEAVVVQSPKVVKEAVSPKKVAKKETPKKVVKKAETPKKADLQSPKKETASPVKGGSEKVAQGKLLPPGFKIKQEDEKYVDLNELSKTTGFVIFFYPKANTPGCTKQACGFRDHYQQILKAGYQVFGMSGDNPGPQTSWKKKNEFPYHLLCDSEGKHLKQFGVFKEPKSVTRSHVIVEKGGMVSQLKIQISPLDSVNEALAFCVKP